MSKTYTVALPLNSDRVLKYTRAERVEFEKRFRHFGLPGMKDILYERVFPIKPDPANDNKPMATGGGDLEAQICLIWLGIRHNNPKRITEEQVGEWLDLAVEEGRPIVGFVATAVNAVMASGVLGFKYERDAIEEEEETVGEGKASPDSSAA